MYVCKEMKNNVLHCIASQIHKIYFQEEKNTLAKRDAILFYSEVNSQGHP